MSPRYIMDVIIFKDYIMDVTIFKKSENPWILLIHQSLNYQIHHCLYKFSNEILESYSRDPFPELTILRIDTDLWMKIQSAMEQYNSDCV